MEGVVDDMTLSSRNTRTDEVGSTLASDRRIQKGQILAHGPVRFKRAHEENPRLISTLAEQRISTNSLQPPSAPDAFVRNSKRLVEQIPLSNPRLGWTLSIRGVMQDGIQTTVLFTLAKITYT
jgi:hypothetical protein